MHIMGCLELLQHAAVSRHEFGMCPLQPSELKAMIRSTLTHSHQLNWIETVILLLLACPEAHHPRKATHYSCEHQNDSKCNGCNGSIAKVVLSCSDSVQGLWLSRTEWGLGHSNDFCQSGDRSRAVRLCSQ